MSLVDDNESNLAPDVTISGVTLTGGGGSDGGAVFVDFNTSATLSSVTLSANNVRFGDGAALGGAVDDVGQAVLDGVTVVGNTASGGDGEGGGIAVLGTAQINNSTIAGNTSDNVGGGVYNQAQTVLVGDTLAGNQAPAGSGGNIDTDFLNSGTKTTFADSIVTRGQRGCGARTASHQADRSSRTATTWRARRRTSAG